GGEQAEREVQVRQGRRRMEVLRPARDGLPWWRGHRTEHATQHARGTERAGDARHAGHAQLTRRADLPERSDLRRSRPLFAHALLPEPTTRVATVALTELGHHAVA